MDIKYYAAILWKDIIFKAILAVFALLAPVATLAHFIIFLVIADLGTALVRDWKKGVKIESKKMRKSVIKLLCYHLLLIVIFLFSKFLISDAGAIEITKYAIGIVLLTELYSIIENLSDITENPAISKLKDFFNRKVEKNVENN